MDSPPIAYSRPSPVRRRVAVVTGASSGIGAAVTRRLVGRGMHVIGVGRDADRLAAAGATTVVRGDLVDLGTVDAVRDAVDGRLDLLVHAAGVGAARDLGATDDACIEEVLAVDLAAVIRLTRALLPALNGGDGRVAVVASIAVVGVAGESAYSAAKAGVRGFADALRTETGLAVTTVLPGIVDTPFTAARDAGPRRAPRAVSADRVARDLLRGVDHRRAEVFVPRWLVVPARLHGVAPGTFARLSRRFG